METLEKVSNGEMTYSNLEYKNFYNRVNELCECAINNNVKILIDAEESWIQKAIDDTAFNFFIFYWECNFNAFFEVSISCFYSNFSFQKKCFTRKLVRWFKNTRAEKVYG